MTWRLDQGSGSNSFYNLCGGDDCGGGTPNLTRAIARSDNCAFVRTELSLGPGNFGADGVKVVIQTGASRWASTPRTSTRRSSRRRSARRACTRSRWRRRTRCFPNEGVLKRATFVTKIVDRNGKMIYQAPTTGVQVLDPNVARTETKMLEGVLRNGTASRTLGSFPRPAAGKTGTTDNNDDAWFVGFTPQYTAAVWMGNPAGEIPMTNVGGITVFGATYPAQIWRTFMHDATAPLPALDFPQPTDSSSSGRG